MILEAKTAILNSGDFLSANEVAKLAGVSAVNPTLQPNKWERDQDIFAIRQGREDEDVTKTRRSPFCRAGLLSTSRLALGLPGTSWKLCPD
jgi:hypothetical protein